MQQVLATTADIDAGEILMGLLGGLSLFLFGMGRMTDAVKAVAGTGMRKLLAKATGNRFVTRLVPDRTGKDATIRPKYLDESQLLAPQVALGSLHLVEICRLGVRSPGTSRS